MEVPVEELRRARVTRDVKFLPESQLQRSFRQRRL